MIEHNFTGNWDDYENIKITSQKKSDKILNLYVKKDASQDEMKLCMDYWGVKLFYNNGGFKYLEKIPDIGERYGISTTATSNAVAKISFIVPDSAICIKCGEVLNTKISLRTQFTEYIDGCGKINLCHACKKENDKKIKEEEEKELERQEEEKIKKYEIDLAKHTSAIENGIYETLSKLELNYLINLAEMGDSSKVAKIMGISDQKRRKFHEKLGELKLIIAHYKGGYYMDTDLNKALCNLEKYSNIKSVFGSKQAYELYKKLKKEYLYVYPEMPLAAFIKMEQVEHLFTENWHNGYFLMCRLDCVVTTPEGIPKFGVEFQGGYHEKEEQQTKDKFKHLLMNDVGLEIQYYNYSEAKSNYWEDMI